MKRPVAVVGVGQTHHTSRRADVNIAGLVREAVDLALRASYKLDPQLVARKLGDDDHWVVAAPSYLEKHALLRSPDDLRRAWPDSASRATQATVRPASRRT